jgi:hypothetical protein
LTYGICDSLGAAAFGREVDMRNRERISSLAGTYQKGKNKKNC